MVRMSAGLTAVLTEALRGLSRYLQTNTGILSRLGHDRFLSNRTSTQYMGADKSLARAGRKQATATEDFDVHISYLLS